jgi:malic enzyme
VWLTPADVDDFPRLLRNGARTDDVRLIVVTDNERILGLGDQGAGGMPIPVGKLAIYSAAAGVPPMMTLPVSLDVGTDNDTLRGDPLYVGHAAPRLRGAAYDEVVERFVEAVLAVFPRAVVQWEDFKGPNALRLLARYRHRVPSFNDDIQGTGATALAAILATERIAGRTLAEHRILLVGAGAAGIGIGRTIRHAAAGGNGPALAMLDRDGLVHTGRSLSPEKAELAVDPAEFPAALLGIRPDASLAGVVAHWRPSILIGTTAVGGRFDEATLRALADATDRPVVLALSNPTAACEVRPQDALAWTGGRALVATGSPFPPITISGHTRSFGQANNAFIFPGLGLGAIVAEAREVTDDMLLVAARTLAESVSVSRLREGGLYPPIEALPTVAQATARAVVREARDSGFGRSLADEEIGPAVTAAAWVAAYDPARA